VVRIGRLAAAVAACALAVSGYAAAVRAQTLQRLSVQSFTLTSDTAAPRPGTPFHLIVTLQVRERLTHVANLELPMLAQLDLLGDERSLQSGQNGTLYRERIALVARDAGNVDVSPAVLQAIDAHDGKPKAFSTNALTLHIAQSPADVLAAQLRAARSVALFLLHVAIWVVGVLCVAVLIALVLQRRPKPPVPAVAPAVETPPSYQTLKRQRLVDGITVLRAEPTRAAAVRVRRAIWNVLGAPEGTTLAELLRTHGGADQRTQAVLRALERAAFTYDADVPGAIADACDAMQRALEA
jgi:hypothetical protein